MALGKSDEKVVYSYEGDISSLKSATKQAISLLGQYEQTIKRASQSETFKASVKSAQTLSSTVTKVTKDIEKLQTKLKKVGDVRMPSGGATSNALKKSLEVLSSQMNQLSSANRVTTKDLTQMKAALRGLRTSISGAKNDTDRLIASEANFQKTLESVRTKAEALRASMSKTRSSMADTFDPINRQLGVFRTLMDSVTAKTQGFKDKASIAFSRVRMLTDACASAFRRTSSEADKGDRSVTKMSGAFSKLKAHLTRTNAAFKSIAKSMQSGVSKITEYTGKLDILNRKMQSTKSSSLLLSRALNMLFSAAAAKGLAEAIKQSVNYVENLNLFTVAMGNSLEMGKQYVAQMQEAYGMDPSNLYQTAGYFYQLNDAIGMADEASAAMSLTLTKMSNDLASLFNLDIKTVTENMASGMQGMTRAVRKYGMDIRVSTLQQTAMEYGLQGQVETMSEANRMALRYLTMLKQANNAVRQFNGDTKDATNTMGDFARNIETPANQLRIFKEQITQLGRAIGNFFIPILAEVLPYINGIIMALRTVLTFLSSLLGFSTAFGGDFTSAAESTAKAVSGVGDAAAKSAKQMKKLTAPFDELNILTEESGAAGGGAIGGMSSALLDPALAEAIKNSKLEIENIQMKANKIRDTILSFLGFQVEAGEIISWDPDILQKNIASSLKKAYDYIQQKLSSWSTPLAASVDNVVQSIVSSVTPLATSLSSTFNVVSSGSITLWNDHIQPMLRQLGDTMAPVLNTLASVWSSVSRVLESVFTRSGELWTNVLQPVLAAVMEGVTSLLNLVQSLWQNVIGPVIEHVASGVADLWISTLEPIFMSLLQIIGNLVEAIMGLWNNVLAPALNWLVSTLGPMLTNLVKGLWDVFSSLFQSLGGAIQGILDALVGVTDFLAGVFTGDWERAWKGIVNIFVGVGNAIISVFELVVNGVIGLVNSMINLVYTGIVSLINSVLSAVNGIAGLLGFDLDLSVDAPPPAIPSQQWPRIPAMATGGVVTSPTYALVGEGNYDEAVIPLGDSPQMTELVQRIADAVDKNTSESPSIEVKVYIGDDEFDAYTYKAVERGRNKVGAQPIKTGG